MLQNGDAFPSLTFARAGGGEMSRYRWTIGKSRRRSSKSTSSVSRSPTAPTHERFLQPPAPSSMTIPSVTSCIASSFSPNAGSLGWRGSMARI